jgi:type IV pilus assembly protein PilC
MPKFAYVAADADGAIRKGVLSADTLEAARVSLAEREVDVKEVTPKKSILQLEIGTAKVKRAELMHLSRQLAAFIRAGIPILDAIDTLAEETDKPAVRRVMSAIAEDLRAGATLSEAVARHPQDFPSFYRGILTSAELTGHLDTVLDQLAVYLERDLEARRKVKSAMMYPAIVLTMAVGTVLVLAIYVLPKFKDFFASLDATLPLPTRMLLSVTDFLATWWWAMLAGLGALIVGYLVSVRFAAGVRFRDKMLLKIPVVGETIRYAVIERFTRLLSSMVTAGVALPEAMRVATESLHNKIYEEALGRARTQMIEGAGLAKPIADTKLFPGVATQMIRVGEDTGSLDTQLDVAAEYYERELDYKIKKVTTLLEPLVIVVVGVIVGFVAIALVSAMYGIFRTANING